MKQLKILAASLALGLASGATSAAVYTDSMTFNQLIPPTYSFTHNITDNGYTPVGTLTGFSLQLTFRDDGDNDGFLCLSGCEKATIDPQGNSGWFIVTLNNSFTSGELNNGSSASATFGTATSNLLYTNATWYLQESGTLQVSVSSHTGDFYLTGSQLVANGTSAPTSAVPMDMPIARRRLRRMPWRASGSMVSAKTRR